MNIELYKQALKERSWTYKDLARETGISLCNISRIMAGIVTEPRHSTIEAIEKALGINFFNYTPEERAEGMTKTRKESITPLEEEMLFAFRAVGQKHGERRQRALIDVANGMADMK